MEGQNKAKRPTPEAVNRSKVLKSYVILQKPKITLTGYSKSTDRTSFSVPELKLLLDAGYCKRDTQPEFLFLTHGHDDHSKDLGYAATRKGGITIYCPVEIVPFVNSYLLSQLQLDLSKDVDPLKLNWTIKGTKAGEEFTFGKSNHKVTVIDCIHSVPCIGFCFSEKRTRLKEPYQKLKADELLKLKKEGIDVQELYYKGLFVYLGDTHIDVFKNNPILFDYPVIIVECTFLFNEIEVIEKANRDGHIHWNDLKPIITSHPTISFVLIHFSLRYTESEIFQFFESQNVENIVIFAGEGN